MKTSKPGTCIYLCPRLPIVQSDLAFKGDQRCELHVILCGTVLNGRLQGLGYEWLGQDEGTSRDS